MTTDPQTPAGHRCFPSGCVAVGPRGFDATDDGIGQGRERVVRRPPQRAAQTDTISWYRKRDDLPAAVWEQFEAARPTALKDVDYVSGLAFLREFLATRHVDRFGLQFRKARQVTFGQPGEGLELACEEMSSTRMSSGLLIVTRRGAAQPTPHPTVDRSATLDPH